MNILGIDLSLNATGIAMLTIEGEPAPDLRSNAGRTHLHQVPLKIGTFTGGLILPPTKSTYRRWRYIVDAVLAYADHAHAICIEGYSFGSNMAYKTATAELGGIVRFHLRQAGHTPHEIEPKVLKKFLTGNGNADKDLMVEYVRRLYGLQLQDHNIADAFGLAVMGAALVGSSRMLPEHQRVVVAGSLGL